MGSSSILPFVPSPDFVGLAVPPTKEEENAPVAKLVLP